VPFLRVKNVPLWNKRATVHVSVSLWPSVSSHLHYCYSLSLSLSVPYVIGRRYSKRIDCDVHQHVLVRYGRSLSAGIITSPLARSQSAFCAFEMRHSNDIHCSVIINVTVTETAHWMAGSNHDTVMCPKYFKEKEGLFGYGGEGGFWRNVGLSASCIQCPNPTAALRNTWKEPKTATRSYLPVYYS